MSRVRWYAAWSQLEKKSYLYHDKWNNVKSQIQGKRLMRYKGFDSQTEAQQWLSEYETTITVTKSVIDTRKHLAAVSGGVEVGQPLGWRVYTDGSYNKKISTGGWGCLWVWSDPSSTVVRHQIWGSVPTGWSATGMLDPPTNNRGELLAIQRALEYTQEQNWLPLTIWSDSKYSIQALTVWYKSWQANGWHTSQGKPVLNQDLLQTILRLLDDIGRSLITFKHVKAHAGHEYNEMVDKLAKRGAGF